MSDTGPQSGVSPDDISEEVKSILASLTIEEKAALSAGSGMFTLTGAPQAGLPSWPVTDGPNGARGSSTLGSGDAISLCIPCGSALGATWDTELIERLGEELGAETRSKRSIGLLAPTVNLHRSPLAGRNFECFSEDPLLSGKAAAAYIRGVQSRGVFTTVKHFVGNEAETERYTMNSIIDERTLRELYLVPFEIAVKEGGALGVMTSYNRLNGRFLSGDRRLLTSVLRGEWGFEGLVMTDWSAGIETVDAALAGTDIEMPSGGPAFGVHLAEAVRDGRVEELALNAMAGRVLTVLMRVGAFEDVPEKEENRLRPHHPALAREAAVAATVLLKNDQVGADPILPLNQTRLHRVAVVGPNSDRAQIMGGGSAALRPQYRVTPLEAIRRVLDERIEVIHEPGATIDRVAPPLTGSAISGPNGEPDLRLEVIVGPSPDGAVVATSTRDQSRLVFADPPIGDPSGFSARLIGWYTPSLDGVHQFEMTQIGEARFTLDGEVVCDAYGIELDRGASFFGNGSVPVVGSVELVAGRQYEFVLEMSSPFRKLSGVELGVRVPVADDAFERAVHAARMADVAIVVVGTNEDWEGEGRDRESLDLPGTQDRLVRGVAEANPRTIVVLNTGAPVHMPWVDDVPAMLQIWFGGQGMADALADVLVGTSDPGGRLPMTFPVRVEHNPSHGNFPGSNGVVRYGEGVFIGYRWYQHRRLPVVFPFGHGLSYTRFELSSPQVDSTGIGRSQPTVVTTTITNTGDRKGTQVVQCYVSPQQPSAPRPPMELKAFHKVHLAPGASETVTFTLDERAFARWHAPDPAWHISLDRYADSLRGTHAPPELDAVAGWVVDAGKYDILVGTSSVDITGRASVTAKEQVRL